jgi:hypothetical protein
MVVAAGSFLCKFEVLLQIYINYGFAGRQTGLVETKSNLPK